MIEKLTSWLNEFDVAKLLPDLQTLLGLAEGLLRFCLFIGPIVMLALGLSRFFVPSREASHRIGFQALFGKGSPEAWDFSQKLCGVVWSVLGIILLFVMVFVNAGCNGEGIMSVCTTVIKTLFIQGILILLVYLLLQVAIGLYFNYNGVPRTKGEL